MMRISDPFRTGNKRVTFHSVSWCIPSLWRINLECVGFRFPMVSRLSSQRGFPRFSASAQFPPHTRIQTLEQPAALDYSGSCVPVLYCWVDWSSCFVGAGRGTDWLVGTPAPKSFLKTAAAAVWSRRGSEDPNNGSTKQRVVSDCGS